MGLGLGKVPLLEGLSGGTEVVKSPEVPHQQTASQSEEGQPRQEESRVAA
jgi:hypothetical protein